MIWTEEENKIRQLENIMSPKGKSCMNCQWSNADEGENMTTCGHHIQNFATSSFCGYWTSKSNPKVKAYFDKCKKELKAKSVPKGTVCPECGEDESIDDWQTYFRCRMCDTKF